MNEAELKLIWKAALNGEPPVMREFELLADAIADLYRSGEPRFSRHISNRWGRVQERTKTELIEDNFTHEMARAFIADEIGFANWNELERFAADPADAGMLFRYAVAAMERGDFTALEESIGKERFRDQIVAWHSGGLFDDHKETVYEILSASCMLGQTETAKYLIEAGVDPYAGMRTWLAGPHYAVSSGRLETVKMLLEKKIPLEVENKYGGTLLGQALWSAINEHTGTHAEIIELLIDAGAKVAPGTLDWWQEQSVPSESTKNRVAAALGRAG